MLVGLRALKRKLKLLISSYTNLDIFRRLSSGWSPTLELGNHESWQPLHLAGIASLPTSGLISIFAVGKMILPLLFMEDLIIILTLRCRPLSSSKEVSSPRWLLSTWEFLARRFPTTLARCLSAVFLGRFGLLKHLDDIVIIPPFSDHPRERT